MGGYSRRHSRETEDETESPKLEVHGVAKTLSGGELVGLGISTIQVDTGDDEVTLLGGEEGGTVGEVDNGERGEETKRDRDDTENDENPLPTTESLTSLE